MGFKIYWKWKFVLYWICVIYKYNKLSVDNGLFY